MATGPLKKLAGFFMKKVESLDPDTRWGCISVVVTDNPGIKEINTSALGRHDITDVISFRFEPLPGSGNTHNAEIYVNAELAFSTPPSRWSPRDELALYIAHGCDHLSGADDATPRQRRRMRSRELRWLREARRKGLL